MEIYILIGAIVIALGAIGFAVYEHVKTRKLIESISDMIDSATEGNFEETAFDESMSILLHRPFLPRKSKRRKRRSTHLSLIFPTRPRLLSQICFYIVNFFPKKTSATVQEKKLMP